MTLLNEHIFWSYRLAKFEVASERRGVGRLAFARFEETLGQKLVQLQERTREASSLFRDIDPGAVWIRPKSVEHKQPAQDDGSSFVSVPEHAHDHHIQEISVRVLLEPTPEFAVAEVIWLRSFGPALETVLTPGCLGNRLDLHGSPPSVPAGGRRVFRYWAPAYRRFKSTAIDAAKSCLRTGNRRCILATLDLTTFYDNIDPSFLLRDDFVFSVAEGAAQAGRAFNEADYREATACLLTAYATFRTKVAQITGVRRKRGIPIGSICSRMIANLTLARLDQSATAVKGVHYYARYVDDILIVFRPEDETFASAKEVIAKFLPIDEGRSTDKRLVADSAVLGVPGTDLVVQPKKLRVFDLRAEQGLEYLAAVEAEMQRVSSERRRFLDPWGAELDQTVMASPNTEPIRALREADALSLRRLAVGTVSDKVATAAAMLDRESSAKYSRRYLGKAARLATDWSRWVDLIDVSLRILGSALASGDAETANEVIEALTARSASLADGVAPSFKVLWGDAELQEGRARRKLREWIAEQLVEVVAGATPFGEDGIQPKDLVVLTEGIAVRGRVLKGTALYNRARRLAAADLRLSDRETDEQMDNLRVSRPEAALLPILASLQQDPEFVSRSAQVQAFVAACDELQDPTFGALSAVEVLLLFRPPTYADIMFRWLRAQRPLTEVVPVVNAVRGTRYGALPMELDEDSMTLFVDPPTENPFDPPKEPANTHIILANLRTEDSWWRGSLAEPTHSAEREKRLTRVVNQALEAAKDTKGTPSLLVLPELALPRRWLRQLCAHLARSEPQVSLVAGLEYDVIRKKNKVYNEALCYIPRPFFAAAMWIWTKQRPAHREAPDLQRLGFSFAKRAEGRRFVRVSSEHGRFLPLICSELLEVDTRAKLIDWVDFVLIPAWNTDTTSFESLVQASALELHSFIAVANNGTYSDCRIRGPYADAWRREVCRLIMRESDGIVSATIPINHLREYRSDAQGYNKRIKHWRESEDSVRKKLEKEQKTGRKPTFTPDEKGVLAGDGKSTRPCPWPSWKPAPPGDWWVGKGEDP
jgi:predicted amidohydrolase